MKTFVVILAVVGLATADIGLGYHYSPPKIQTSYGTPSYSISSGNGGYNTGYKGQALSSASNVYQTTAGFQNGYPSQVHTAGVGYQGNVFQSGTGYQSGSGYQTGTGYNSGAGHQTAGYQTDNTRYQTTGYYSGADSIGNQYQTGGSFGVSDGSLQGVQGLNQYQSANQYQQYYNQVQQQPAQIFKHFYVHAAPEEPELPRPRQPVVLPAPQKHYKIIFIKTPAPVVGSTQFVPVQQQNEEKTIVYVLVKKPEATEDIVVPKIEQKPPSKPEVFFIKYKGKEDSQAVINNIVNEYNSGKESVNVAGAFHSSGTLDSIADVKYVPQSVVTSQSTGSGFGVQALSGSSGSQYEASSGSVDQSLSSGSFESGSSGSSFQSQSFGSSSAGYPSSTAGYHVSTAAPIQIDARGSDSTGAFSSTVTSTGGQSAFSSQQGIPHETYGTPKFSNN
ncbi:uncharacterized protein LOC125241251 [Leguminivora glycinivorella]|uniref:uncharacterized protein LOC125241251 n=1 Tax=Leguminivora glycinivorella TaxID=1035111 RepID=UPI00200D5D15|nr:uncharacterized protein LOC125241251 [Leguminivora glycinivorella]